MPSLNLKQWERSWNKWQKILYKVTNEKNPRKLHKTILYSIKNCSYCIAFQNTCIPGNGACHDCPLYKEQKGKPFLRYCGKFPEEDEKIVYWQAVEAAEDENKELTIHYINKLLIGLGITKPQLIMYVIIAYHGNEEIYHAHISGYDDNDCLNQALKKMLRFIKDIPNATTIRVVRKIKDCGPPICYYLFEKKETT